MARLEEMSEEDKRHIPTLPCPSFERTPWVAGPPLSRRRVAIISTAGLHRRGDRPFEAGAFDYRIIPADTPAAELVMSHISANFDRTGFQQDWNVVFPLERLREMAAEGIIGTVARDHYSFMGATDPARMEDAVRGLARIMKRDGVNAVLLVPV